MRSSKRTAIPDDWTLPDEWRKWTQEKLKWTGVSVTTEGEKFHDYHLMHGSLMASWVAAWRTWCRRAQSFEGNKIKKVDTYGESREYLERSFFEQYGTKMPRIT